MIKRADAHAQYLRQYDTFPVLYQSQSLFQFLSQSNSLPYCYYYIYYYYDCCYHCYYYGSSACRHDCRFHCPSDWSHLCRDVSPVVGLQPGVGLHWEHHSLHDEQIVHLRLAASALNLDALHQLLRRQRNGKDIVSFEDVNPLNQTESILGIGGSIQRKINVIRNHHG
jgi:hypothetical protein